MLIDSFLECSNEICNKLSHFDGLCHYHYGLKANAENAHSRSKEKPGTREYILENSKIEFVLDPKDPLYSDISSPCWLWIKSLTRDGYPRATHDSMGDRRAHSQAYKAFIGEYDSSILEICHKCDIRNCVNPDHLYPDTHLNNLMDSKIKGRNHGAKEERNCKSKINKRYAAEIKDLYEYGFKPKEISEIYGLSSGHISKIGRGVHWNRN